MKNTSRGLAVLRCIPALLAFLGWSVSANAYPVAGLSPNHRPEGAPVVTSVAERSAKALYGVVEPIPVHVTNFMKDQGNWYTPFIHPGMTNSYDIRGWHSNPPTSGNNSEKR